MQRAIDAPLIRAGLYLRISDDRTGREAGVTRQREDGHELAEQIGVQIVDEYRDNDTSATSGKPRPEYRRLIADMIAGHLDVVICWHPDRLYRRPADLEELVEVVERHRVMIRTVKAGDLDLATPTGRMVARILGAVALAEVERKVERWSRAVLQNREAGKWVRSRHRLFGYDRDGRIKPGEARWAAFMAEQLVAGRSLYGIEQAMTAAGVRTTQGNVWAAHNIRNYVLNPRIAGLSTHNGEIIGVGEWRGILDRQAWERAAGRLAPGRGAAPRRAVAAGVLWCGNMTAGGRCGARMTTGSRSRDGQTTRTYRCRKVAPYAGCGCMSVVAEPVEAIVEGYARAKFTDPRFVAAVAARLGGDSSGRAQILADLDELEDRHAALADELPRAKGRTAAAVVAALAATETEIERARARLANLGPVRLPDLRGGWPNDVETRNTLVRLSMTGAYILPTGRGGGRVFNRDRVQIIPVEAVA